VERLGKTITDLLIGEEGIIKEGVLPLQLIERGILPNEKVKLLQTSLFNGCLYLNIGGNYLALGYDVAAIIEIV